MTEYPPPPPEIPKPQDVHFSDDVWNQVLTHMPDTDESLREKAEAAQRTQQLVEELVAAQEYPLRPLESVRRLVEPFVGAEIAGVNTAWDGRLLIDWRGDGKQTTSAESPDGRSETLDISLFQHSVDYVMPLPSGNWLRYQARVTPEVDRTLTPAQRARTAHTPDSAWVIDTSGHVIASGSLGDACLEASVGSAGQIWVPYFDEAPQRGLAGIWERNAHGDMEFVEDSIVPTESVAEDSGYGRFTAGYTGMTIFDENLRVVGRHDREKSDTDICEVYMSATDGERYWYFSYPDWNIDCVGPEGQAPPIHDDRHKAGFLIAAGEQIAFFSGPGPDRDSLFLRKSDGSEEMSIVTMPNGAALTPGMVAAWGGTLHYVADNVWYRVDALTSLAPE
ncbi:MAG: hypothetical protein QM774_02215 [Gordonia sp. (in: high G+C Gram-positive bacteria)]|uniref:hypothetical protein n=1 Tax=Gordonia sp. (in: high G+C Gram-positive bacteria) TaxID=84139 RepID=UPI0039E27AA9